MMSSSAHEPLVEFRYVPPPTDRKFGTTIGIILLGFAALRWIVFEDSGWSTMALVALGTLLILSGLLAPHLLAPLNRGWMKLGMVLGAIVNPIILLLMFAILFVPLGLVLQAARRDVLQLARKRASDSYWNDRLTQTTGRGSLSDQF
jgi:hypothetical protein